jgi:diacylglycerol kinase family enzyme
MWTYTSPVKQTMNSRVDNGGHHVDFAGPGGGDGIVHEVAAIVPARAATVAVCDCYALPWP